MKFCPCAAARSGTRASGLFLLFERDMSIDISESPSARKTFKFGVFASFSWSDQVTNEDSKECLRTRQQRCVQFSCFTRHKAVPDHPEGTPPLRSYYYHLNGSACSHALIVPISISKTKKNLKPSTDLWVVIIKIWGANF